MWVLKERRHLRSWRGRRSEWCWRGATRLYILYIEEIMTRVIGCERWHHNHPMDMVSWHGALKDAFVILLSPLLHMASKPHLGEVEAWARPRRSNPCMEQYRAKFLQEPLHFNEAKTILQAAKLPISHNESTSRRYTALTGSRMLERWTSRCCIS